MCLVITLITLYLFQCSYCSVFFHFYPQHVFHCATPRSHLLQALNLTFPCFYISYWTYIFVFIVDLHGLFNLIFLCAHHHYFIILNAFMLREFRALCCYYICICPESLAICCPLVLHIVGMLTFETLSSPKFAFFCAHC